MSEFKTENLEIKFFEVLNRLKTLRRQGWIGKVPQSEIESVADHSFGVAFLASALVPLENELRLRDQETQLNKLEILEKSILHDVGESLYFDIDKSFLKLLGDEESSLLKRKLDKKSETLIQKSYKELEKKLIDFNLSVLNFHNPDLDTDEDCFVKFLDRLELFLQTKYFLVNGMITKTNAEPFLDSCLKSIEALKNKFKIIQELLKIL